MGVINLAVMIGLSALAGSLIGGAVSGAIGHWLDTPRPVPRARWRVGPAEIVERDRAHLRESRERMRRERATDRIRARDRG